MRIRATFPPTDTFECPAIVSNHHPRCCFGHDVLVLMAPDGGAVGPREAAFAGYEVVEATDEERSRLIDAGYRLKGLDQGQCLMHA